MASFNLADLFETTGGTVPDRLALVAGGTRLTYADLDERATRVGRHLQGAGVKPGDHVAVLARNRAEWLEVLLGAAKARAAAVNVNHRYVDAELHHVLADSGSIALVVERTYMPAIDRIAADLPALRHVVVLDDETDDTHTGGIGYEEALAAAPNDVDFGSRSGDDPYLLYTGGTTGAPKAVLWRSEDLFFAALGGGNPGGPPIERPEQLADVLAPERQPWLVTSPLMHGNGQWNSLMPLLTGRGVVLWTGHRFDAAEVARLAEAERAHVLILVGDGMALPFVDAVEADPAKHDLSNLAAVVSGGAILSPAVKARLAEVLPGALILDGFGASETGTSGTLVGGGGSGPPRFTMNADTAVLDDDLRPLPPGSPQVGRLGRRGHIPLGYWNDPDKTAAAFPVGPDGTRWAVPGDLAVCEADGTIALLGRGSSCINTGGEKVYPEEVAAALKSHPAIADAFVVGVPDERFGEQVAAVIRVRDGQAPDLDDVRRHLRPLLAGYKAPRRLVVVDELQYTAQGKPDLAWARQQLTPAPTATGS